MQVVAKQRRPHASWLIRFQDWRNGEVNAKNRADSTNFWSQDSNRTLPTYNSGWIIYDNYAAHSVWSISLSSGVEYTPQRYNNNKTKTKAIIIIVIASAQPFLDSTLIMINRCSEEQNIPQSMCQSHYHAATKQASQTDNRTQSLCLLIFPSEKWRLSTENRKHGPIRMPAMHTKSDKKRRQQLGWKCEFGPARRFCLVLASQELFSVRWFSFVFRSPWVTIYENDVRHSEWFGLMIHIQAGKWAGRAGHTIADTIGMAGRSRWCSIAVVISCYCCCCFSWLILLSMELAMGKGREK